MSMYIKIEVYLKVIVLNILWWELDLMGVHSENKYTTNW